MTPFKIGLLLVYLLILSWLMLSCHPTIASKLPDASPSWNITPSSTATPNQEESLSPQLQGSTEPVGTGQPIATLAFALDHPSILEIATPQEFFESPMPDPFTLTPFPTDTPSLVQTLEQTGIRVYGDVVLKDGTGLPNVRVYLSLAAYSGGMIAVTDNNGGFQADFKYIPGDENVTVWAELEGYSFMPAYHIWRHYHGLEKRMLVFTAAPDP